MPKLVSAACLVLLVAAFAGAATIQVTEIKASGSGDKVTVDPKLSDIAGELAKTFRFSKYEFVASHSSSVKTGATVTWKLATGDSLDVTLNSVEDSDGKTFYSVTAEVYSVGRDGKRNSVTKLTIRNPKGGVWLLGIQPRSGYTPILAIKAQ